MTVVIADCSCSVAALVAGLVLWTFFLLQLRWRELAALTDVLGLMDPGPIRLKAAKPKLELDGAIRQRLKR